MINKRILSLLLLLPCLSWAGELGVKFDIIPDTKQSQWAFGGTCQSCHIRVLDVKKDDVEEISSEADICYKSLFCTFTAPEDRTIRVYYNIGGTLVGKDMQARWITPLAQSFGLDSFTQHLDISGTVTKEFQVSCWLKEKDSVDEPFYGGGLKFFNPSKDDADIVTAQCDITGDVED